MREGQGQGWARPLVNVTAGSRDHGGHGGGGSLLRVRSPTGEEVSDPLLGDQEAKGLACSSGLLGGSKGS